MEKRTLNSARIKKAMESLGINQAGLAKRLGVSREAVSKWLHNEKFPRASKLLAMAKQLQLQFDELVIQKHVPKPIVAFRTYRNRPVSPEKETAANDIGHMLRVLVPYLDRPVFSVCMQRETSLEYAYIQRVAEEIRNRTTMGSGVLEIDHIIKLYQEFAIILIPVLWGVKGDNGMYVKLPDENITFIYVNLETYIPDMKFWLLHEFAHVVTSDLDGKHAEPFADRLAAAILFPRTLADCLYHELKQLPTTGRQVNRIKELAKQLQISPFTILQEVNAYAGSASLSTLQIQIGGAATNVNSAVGLLSERLFPGGMPTAESYLNNCVHIFKTTFFAALSRYLHETGADAGIVHRLMNIPIADAKGIHEILANQDPFT